MVRSTLDLSMNHADHVIQIRIIRSVQHTHELWLAFFCVVVSYIYNLSPPPRCLIVAPAHWHQVNFRPYKPLPRDVSYQQPVRRTSIFRTIFEFLLGILCLGIPFLFVDKARDHGHFDIEGSHLPESTTPLFVIGACACLVVRFLSFVLTSRLSGRFQKSAIILSASVTLMSFPGLDSVTRIGGLVAITCSVLSMVSSFVSIFRYKSEMARGTGPSVEGFVMLSVR